MIRSIVFALVFFMGTVTFAGLPANLNLYFGGESDIPTSGSANVTCLFDNTGTSDVDGWSYGVCHDPAAIMINTFVVGSTTATVNGGAAPGFESIAVVPGEGCSQGIVIDLFGVNKLAPGTGYELGIINYTALTEPGTTDVCYCDTIGVPPVATVIVIGGASIVPTQTCATVNLVGVTPPLYHFVAGDAEVTYDPNTGIAYEPSISLEFGIADNLVFGDASDNTQGFSMDNGCNVTFLTPTAVYPVGELAAVNGGAGPEFFTPQLYPTIGEGWIVGAVYNLQGGVFIQYPQYPVSSPVIGVDYDTNASTLVGDLVGITTPLEWRSDLGLPPVANVVVVAGLSLDTVLEDGTVAFNAVDPTDFVRSDCNDDGFIDVADGIFLLMGYTIFTGPPGPCDEACDINDDDFIDVSDAVYVLDYLFGFGPAPFAPFPDCGEELDAPCVDYTHCPQ